MTVLSRAGSERFDLKPLLHSPLAGLESTRATNQPQQNQDVLPRLHISCNRGVGEPEGSVGEMLASCVAGAAQRLVRCFPALSHAPVVPEIALNGVKHQAEDGRQHHCGWNWRRLES